MYIYIFLNQQHTTALGLCILGVCGGDRWYSCTVNEHVNFRLASSHDFKVFCLPGNNNSFFSLPHEWNSSWIFCGDSIFTSSTKLSNSLLCFISKSVYEDLGC